MIATFESYSAMPMSLTMKEMAALHRGMAEEIGDDSDGLELYADLVGACIKYLEYRSNWPLWSREEKMEKDSLRTSRHNMVILCFNQLARYLKLQGKAAAWREALGEDIEKGDCRKRAGDFACYIAFVESVHAR